MVLSAAQYQRLIIRQCGMTDDEAFAETVALLWELHADRGETFGTPLQFLYVKRDAIDDLLGIHVLDHDIKDDERSASRSQIPKNIREIRETVVLEIERLEKRGRAGAAPLVGEITQKTPRQVVTGTLPDPDDPFYAGDALRRAPWPPRS